MRKLLRGLDGIRTVIFPSTVSDMGAGAFYQATSLKSVIMNDRIEYIESNGHDKEYKD